MTLVLSRAAARRIACAVVAAEVHRVRGTRLTPPDDWPENLPIGESGLELDSLEQLGALGALAETFGLDDAMLGPEPPLTVESWIDWIMRCHASQDSVLTVKTSGSTGNPVPCPHAVSTLVEEARFLATQLPERRRVLALVPAHHIYGIIWTAILPSVLNVPVVACAIGSSFDLASGDLVVAVPDQWRAILRFNRSFPADVIGISSAGPLDDALAADLLASSLTRLVDIYGSTETGGIAIRELPSDTYDLLPRWHLLSHGEDDWQLGDVQGVCHSLPDHVERIGERGLRPIGRRDGAVQIGGHNVWPARVAEMLRQLDGISDASVRLDQNGRLKAFVVPKCGHDPADLATMIERVTADQLSAPARPKSVRFGEALPRNSMGKLEDWI